MRAELPRRPLLAPERVTLFGFDPDELDTGLFPLANFPHFAGLTLARPQRPAPVLPQPRLRRPCPHRGRP